MASFLFYNIEDNCGYYFFIFLYFGFVFLHYFSGKWGDFEIEFNLWILLKFLFIFCETFYNQMRNQKKVSKNSKKHSNFNLYIYKTLKTVHVGLRISKKSIKVINSMLMEVLDRLALTAAQLSRIRKRSTMSWQDLHSAVRLIFPGELRKHALS